jgi:ABC-type bacteriocin/lantibiotic exporter with double-glycine peptidase domain
MVVLRPLRGFASKYLLGNLCLYAAIILFSLDPLAIRFLIDRGLSGHNPSAVVAALLALLAIYGLRVVLLFVGNIVSAAVAQRLMFEIRSSLFRRLLASPTPFYERRGVGDLMVLLNGDVELVGAIISERIPTLVGAILGGVVILAIMLSLQWKLTCLAFPAVPFFFLLRARFRGKMEIAGETSRQMAGEQASCANEALKGIFQIQLLGAGRAFHRKYVRLAVRSLRSVLSQRRLEVIYGMVSIAIMGTISTAVLGFGAALVWRETLTIGGFVAFYSYLLRLLDPVNNVIQSYAQLKLSEPSFRRIGEVAATVPTPSLGRLTTDSVSGTEIICENVAFGYGSDCTILKKVDLAVAEGRTVALRGPSGSGKSTLSKLMVGCHSVRAGVIRLNGAEIGRMSLEELRSKIGLVPQDGMLFSGTIRENAILGRRQCSEDRLQELAHIACFDEVVSRLPGKWEQPLGPEGAGLSGGERQRLMILRALVQDCPVLILDEATSCLDPDLESRMLERLSVCTREKAVLVITHRDGPARWADEILHLGLDGMLTWCGPGRKPYIGGCAGEWLANGGRQILAESKVDGE